MITVYTRLDGKLAQWEVESNDINEAIDTVKQSLPNTHKLAVLARIK